MTLPALAHAERDAYTLGVMRIALGVLLIVQTLNRLLELEHVPYFGDVFHLPIVPEALVPSAAGYVALLVVSLVAAAVAVVGVRPREGLFVASSIGLFLLLCDRREYHNNRLALLLFAFLAAFSPCDRSLMFVRRGGLALDEAARRAPFFATRLLRLQVSAIYVSSGGGKLLDPDWRSGQTMGVRFASAVDYLARHGRPLPDLVARIYASPDFASVASKAAIATELFLAVGLWLPRTRTVAFYLGALFHLGIEQSAQVELFSYVMAAGYVAFVVPELGERVVQLDPATPLGRVLARTISWLDWLRRFRIERRIGSSIRVLDRAGRAAGGVGALAVLARGLPLLFPLFGPLALTALFFRRGSSPQ